MPTTPAILQGRTPELIFATADEIGVTCGCPCHADLDQNIIFISIDSDAFGSLVMRIIDEKPKRFPEHKAFAIAIETVEGVVREVFEAHFEPLAEMVKRYDRERLAHFVLNEAALELVLHSIHDNVVYFRAWDDAIAEMKVERELSRKGRKRSSGTAANISEKPGEKGVAA